MFTIALTGGIATGKTAFARAFRELTEGVAFFDCDAQVQELLEETEVIEAVDAALGGGFCGPDGGLDRGRLREVVFADEAQRKRLEGVLHPRVREACWEAMADAVGNCRFFLADVPLLYETEFPLARDLDLVVACGPQTQVQRLLARSRFSEILASRIVAAQLPIAEKMNRADVTLWNGGTPAALRRQTESFSLWLKKKIML